MRLSGFSARRRMIAPAFVVALALNADLFSPEGPERVPLALPRDMPLAAVGTPASSGSWGGAPVAPALVAKKVAAPVQLTRQPDLKARREAIEKRLRASGAITPAFVRLRALAEQATPLSRITRALDAARRKSDPGELKRVLETALAGADAEDLITRERLLRLLASALAQAGQADAARAKAREADELLKRVTEIELAEMEQHREAREAYKKLGRDPVAERKTLLARLADGPPNVPGLLREDDKKRMDELQARLEKMRAEHPADAAAEQAAAALGRQR